MGWDELEREASKEGSGKYIKLRDGESVTGVFRGEPSTYYQIYQDKKRYRTYQEGSSFRFEIPFIIKNGESYERAMFSQGKTTAKALIAARDEYGFEDSVFKIVRKGSGKDDTVYHIFYKGKLASDKKEVVDEAFKKVEPSTGEFNYDEHEPVFDEEPSSNLGEDVPF